MADTGTIDMPHNVYSVVMYIMCTNFGAFITEWSWFGMLLPYYCPVGLVLPLHYSAIIEKVVAILYKSRWFLP